MVTCHQLGFSGEVVETLSFGRGKHALCWAGKPAKVRTLRTKLGVSLRDDIDFAVSEGLDGMKVAQRRCGESPRSKLQRVSSEDLRTPVLGQAVNQSAEVRSALVFFATAQSFRERSLESVNRTGFENPLKSWPLSFFRETRAPRVSQEAP